MVGDYNHSSSVSDFHQEVSGTNNQYVIKALGIDDRPLNITGTCEGALNPSKDVDESFTPVSDDNNDTLIDFNTSVVGTGGLVSTTPPTDANVTVIDGVCVHDGCGMN